MSDALREASVSAAPGAVALRRVRLLRAVVLLGSGFAIAFTAPLHEQVAFVRWSIVASLVLIGFATVAEYAVLRSVAGSWPVALRALVAFAAAAGLVLAPNVEAIAVLIAVWAAINAAIAVLRLARGSQPRSVGVPSALLSGALAVTALIFRADPVAVVGLFGAYAVVRGVFLGISAFDARVPVAEASAGERAGTIDGQPTAI